MSCRDVQRGHGGCHEQQCIKLVNAIIVSRAVPTTGSPQTEWVLINVALWCVCVPVVCVCACGVCVCGCVCVCVTLAD